MGSVLQHQPVFKTPDAQRVPGAGRRQCPRKRQYFFGGWIRDAVKCRRRGVGPDTASSIVRRVLQTAATRRRFGRRGTCQWSHLSHFSSCLTVLVLETPQGAVLEVAHEALSMVSWPQPYLCTTLVHMLAGAGAAWGVGCTAAAPAVAAWAASRGEAGWQRGRADWRAGRALLVVQTPAMAAWARHGARAQGKQLGGVRSRAAGAEGRRTADEQHASTAKLWQPRVPDVCARNWSGRPGGGGRAAPEFYRGGIAARRPDGTSGNLLDCCRPFATQSATVVYSRWLRAERQGQVPTRSASPHA